MALIRLHDNLYSENGYKVRLASLSSFPVVRVWIQHRKSQSGYVSITLG